MYLNYSILFRKEWLKEFFFVFDGLQWVENISSFQPLGSDSMYNKIRNPIYRSGSFSYLVSTSTHFPGINFTGGGAELGLKYIKYKYTGVTTKNETS